jgi:hypothetical protein
MWKILSLAIWKQSWHWKLLPRLNFQMAKPKLPCGNNLIFLGSPENGKYEFISKTQCTKM